MGVLRSQITALHGIGADAMDNLFDINITFPTKVLEATPPEDGRQPDSPTEGQILLQHFALRAEGFTPPKFTQKKYEVRYKTIGMNRPAARIDGPREFQIVFRLDAAYQVYKHLLKWRSLLFEPTVGLATQNLPSPGDGTSFGSISVSALTSPPVLGGHSADGNAYEQIGVTTGYIGYNGNLDATWQFQDVWLSEVTEPQYKNGGGDLQKITATFQFGDFTAPSSQSSNRMTAT